MRKTLTKEDLVEGAKIMLSPQYFEQCYKAMDGMRKGLNDTLATIVDAYAEPKVSRPFSTESLKAAGIEIHSAVSLTSDLFYKVLQHGKQIGPDVVIKWPGIEV